MQDSLLQQKKRLPWTELRFAATEEYKSWKELLPWNNCQLHFPIFNVDSYSGPLCASIYKYKQPSTHEDTFDFE
jgi:hypothetical protein